MKKVKLTKTEIKALVDVIVHEHNDANNNIVKKYQEKIKKTKDKISRSSKYKKKLNRIKEMMELIEPYIIPITGWENVVLNDMLQEEFKEEYPTFKNLYAGDKIYLYNKVTVAQAQDIGDLKKYVKKLIANDKN